MSNQENLPETSLPPPPETVSLELAAAYLDCTVDTVRRKVRKGLLEGHGTRSVCMKSIGEYLRSGGVRSYGRPRVRHILGGCTTAMLEIDPILREGQVVNIHCEDIGLIRTITPFNGGQIITVDIVGGRGVLILHMRHGQRLPFGDVLVTNGTELTPLRPGQIEVDVIKPPGADHVD